jgi:sodium transport system permease protein
MEPNQDHDGAVGSGPRPASDIILAIITYIFTLTLFATLGGLVMRLEPAWGLALTSILIAFLPTAIAAWLSPLGWRRTLHLAPLPLNSAGWILLAAPAAFLVAGQFAALQARLLPVPTEYLSYFESILKQVNAQGPWIGVLVVAVLPALCEEPLFRGLILGSLLRRMPESWACLLVGLMFGVFHLDPYRLASTAFLGFFLALLVARTGSLLASILAHLLNNLAAELFMLLRLLPDQEAYGITKLLPWPPVLLAAVVLAFCISRLQAQAPSATQSS